MKIRDGFVVREVAGGHVAVPVGNRNAFRGMVQLNASGLMLWELLAEERTEAELIDAVLERYEIDRETARRDVEAFLTSLADANILALSGTDAT